MRQHRVLLGAGWQEVEEEGGAVKKLKPNGWRLDLERSYEAYRVQCPAYLAYYQLHKETAASDSA